MPERTAHARALDEFAALRAIGPQLCIYETLLRRWQSRINLVGEATLPDLWWRHFADSAQLLASFKSSRCKTLVDLGSGAGFPGLVLALALGSGTRVTLVEADHRKAAFLREVSRETGADIAVETSRAEQLIEVYDAPDIVTSRALASPARFANLIAPWLKAGTTGFVLAGASFDPMLTPDVRATSHPSRTGPGFVVQLERAESGPS